jgi:16S rRNA (guanine966-N2)-methyltransferase
MTRIIGGIAGSRVLAAPAKTTRPTSDRIRESIFNRLEARFELDDSCVLDLYAGTGALGLEAASRGASRVTLVEKDSKAALVCQKNARMIQDALLAAGASAEIQTVTKSVDAVLTGFRLAPPTRAFDLVFIDPPYEVSSAEVAENLQALMAALSEDALIVLERSSRSTDVALPTGLTLAEVKNYGDTKVFWLERV